MVLSICYVTNASFILIAFTVVIVFNESYVNENMISIIKNIRMKCVSIDNALTFCVYTWLLFIIIMTDKSLNK